MIIDWLREMAYNDNIGETQQEEWSAKVLPEAGLVLRVVSPRLQQLRI